MSAPYTIRQTPCELCLHTGGILLWENPFCRVIRVEDKDYPGYCRVIWNNHIKEQTDLEPDESRYLMQIVFAVEAILRAMMQPDKINLASFGNMTPHLHWHIIPRWQDDVHFPQPIWGEAQRKHAHHLATPPSDEEIAHALRDALITISPPA